MADRNFINQVQGDSTSADAAKHVKTIDVNVPASNRSGPYYPGNAKCILLIATATAVKFEMKMSGSSTYRSLIMSAEFQNANSTKVGVVNKGAIPHEFYLLDTSGSDNACTMHFIY